MLRTVCSVLVLVLFVGAVERVDAGTTDVLGRIAVTLPSVSGQDVDFNDTKSGGVCASSDATVRARRPPLALLARRWLMLRH
jgi:hypothetical protein